VFISLLETGCQRLGTLPLRFSRRLRLYFHKLRLAHIGRETLIYPRVQMLNPGKISIGSQTSIAGGTSLRASSRGAITIGDRCAIAAFTRIVTATHDPDVLPVSSVGINRSVVIGDDVWIGTGATILPGVSVGSGAIVAAGAVVAEDVAPDSMVGGVPARLIRKLPSREERIQNGKNLRPKN
jgi:maltose O-acetyltransferase